MSLVSAKGNLELVLDVNKLSKLLVGGFDETCPVKFTLDRTIELFKTVGYNHSTIYKLYYNGLSEIESSKNNTLKKTTSDIVKGIFDHFIVEKPENLESLQAVFINIFSNNNFYDKKPTLETDFEFGTGQFEKISFDSLHDKLAKFISNNVFVKIKKTNTSNHTIVPSTYSVNKYGIIISAYEDKNSSEELEIDSEYHKPTFSGELSDFADSIEIEKGNKFIKHLEYELATLIKKAIDEGYGDSKSKIKLKEQAEINKIGNLIVKIFPTLQSKIRKH